MNNKPEGLTMSEPAESNAELITADYRLGAQLVAVVAERDALQEQVQKLEAQLISVTESRDQWKANAHEFNKCANRLDVQLAELAAQEPVAWGNIEYLRSYGYCSIFENKDNFIGEPNTPLYTRAAPPAPLTVKLPQGTGWCSDPYNHGRNNEIRECSDALRDACAAAGIKLQIEGQD